MKIERARRLKKIKTAQCSLEDSLLKMRNCADCNPTLEQDEAFKWLYYLIGLAKKSKEQTPCRFNEREEPNDKKR